MTGEEIKSSRKLLGLSQAKLGEKLHMTRVMIGLMERGEKPIEKRTELSVWCLLYEHMIEIPPARTNKNASITASTENDNKNGKSEKIL